MGQNIGRLATQQGHNIVATVDNEKDWIAAAPLLPECDVAIIFTIPSLAVHYIMECFNVNLPVVIGTTGWNDKLEEIKSYTNSNGKALIYGSNFSIGVNILFDLNRRLAALMSKFGGYTVNIEETHHVHKLDAPSGTAITLSEAIPNYDISNIESVREGEVIGDHKVTYSSDVDTITITHSANNRDGFALGAIMAAKWLIGKHGFYTMQDAMSY